jgi:hypothetical protein
MKMADVLRSIADELEGKQHGDHAPENTEKSSDDFQHEIDHVDHTDDSDGHTMVPPLQQKLELLKKASGVPSMFDQGEDELGDIKKLTGIKAVIAHEADEDITG